jgi:heme A synthase
VPTPSEQRRARLDRSLNGILALIGVQFFLGMWLNLFGSYPSGSGGLGTALTYTSDPILIAHIVVGVVLGIGALVLVVQAWADPMHSMRWFALGGLVGILFAAATGSGFVSSGYSSGVDSFLMAVGFAIALTAYYEGLVRFRADRAVRARSVVAAVSS